MTRRVPPPARCPAPPSAFPGPLRANQGRPGAWRPRPSGSLRRRFRREVVLFSQVPFPAASHRTAAVAADRHEVADEPIHQPALDAARWAIAAGACGSAGTIVGCLSAAPSGHGGCSHDLSHDATPRVHPARRTGRPCFGVDRGRLLPRILAPTRRSRGGAGCANAAAFILPVLEVRLPPAFLLGTKTLDHEQREDGCDRGIPDRSTCTDDGSVVLHEWGHFGNGASPGRP